jgi:hypothetical protein
MDMGSGNMTTHGTKQGLQPMMGGMKMEWKKVVVLISHCILICTRICP